MKRLVISLFLGSSLTLAYAQQSVSIGTTETKANAVLYLKGDGTQGLIIPVTGNHTNVAPTAGMIVYNSTDNKIYKCDGSNWSAIEGGSGGSDSQILSINGNNLAISNGNTIGIAAGTAPTQPGQLMMWDGAHWTSSSATVPTTTGQVLKWNGTTKTWEAGTDNGGGSGVTSITATAPITASGATTTPVIGFPSWPAANATGVLTNNGTGTLSWQAASSGTGTVTNVTGTAPITITNPTTTPAIAINQANTTTNGYLSSTDWNTFNSKLGSGATAGGDLTGTYPNPTVAANAITSTKIAAGAVGLTQLASGPANNVLTTNGSGVPTWAAGGSGVTGVTAAAPLTTTGTAAAPVINFPSWPTNATGILSNNGTGTLSWQTPTATGTAGGDLTGTFPNPTIANGAISGGTGGKITDATITGADLATNIAISTTGNLSVNSPGTISGNGSGITTLSAGNISTGTLAVARGGTGATTVTNGGVAYGAAGNYAFTPTGTAGQVLTSNGAAAPTWTNAGLSSTLAPANIFVGNGSSVASGVAMSGDATITSTGAVTLANNTTTRTNLGLGSFATLNNPLIASGDIVYGTGATPTRLGIGSLGQVLTVTIGGIPGWQAVPSPFSTANVIPKGNGTGLVASQIFDNGTNVGIGTSGPSQLLDVIGGNINTNKDYMIGGTSVLKYGGTNVVVGGLTPAASIGSHNSILGIQAAQSLSSGTDNTYIGFQSGSGTTSGSSNTFIGSGSGTNTTTGTFNIFIGSSTGLNHATGTQNIAIGNGADVANSAVGSISIGHNAFTSANNSMALGGTGADAINVGINTNNPTERLDVVGNVKFSGALMPNNTPGTPGQVLTSAGGGTPPTWSTLPGGFSTLNTIPKGDGTTLVASQIFDDGTNIGIGTTAPAQKLDITGYLRIAAGVGASNDGLLLATPSPGFSIISAGARASTNFQIIQTNNAPMTFHTNSVERMRIDGVGAVTFGTSNSANGAGSFAAGSTDAASGILSTSFGSNNTSSGSNSTTIGQANLASGARSFAGGVSSTASGNGSTALGEGTLAGTRGGFAVGHYNIGGGTASNFISTEPVFEVGIGASAGSPANALTVLHGGEVGIGTPTPAAKLDVQGGDINVSGKVTNNTSGTSNNMLPIAYAYISSTGAIIKSSANISATGTGLVLTGQYEINLPSETFGTPLSTVSSAYIIMGSVQGNNNGQVSFVAGGSTNLLRVLTFDGATGAAANRAFSVIIYKP